MNRRARAFLPLFAAVAIGSCLPGCERPSAAPASATATQTVGDSGSIRAELTVTPTTLTTAQRFRVVIDVTLPAQPAGLMLAPIDLAAVLPEGMTIAEERAPERRVEPDGRTRVRRSYLIDPFLEGAYELGALTLSAELPVVSGEAKAEDDRTHASISTAPVELTITSVLSEQDSALAAEKSVVDPPPAPWWSNPWLWGAAAAATAIASAIILAVRRRRARSMAPVFVTAHELALQRLSELMERRLVEKGQFKEFYQEASLVLRRYIEERFGLHAPERTTEEFLAESRSSALLLEDDVRVLKVFLDRCDMVKFAAAVPTTADAQGIAASVRQFVERTRSDTALVELPRERRRGRGGRA